MYLPLPNDQPTTSRWSAIPLARAIAATAWALRNCSVCNDLTKDLRWVNEQLAVTLRLLWRAQRNERLRRDRERRTLDARKTRRGYEK